MSQLKAYEIVFWDNSEYCTDCKNSKPSFSISVDRKPTIEEEKLIHDVAWNKKVELIDWSYNDLRDAVKEWLINNGFQIIEIEEVAFDLTEIGWGNIMPTEAGFSSNNNADEFKELLKQWKKQSEQNPNFRS